MSLSPALPCKVGGWTLAAVAVGGIWLDDEVTLKGSSCL